MNLRHDGQLAQSLFMQQQEKHSCTDCGHTYLATESRFAGCHRRRVVGGGTIVSSGGGPLREMHLLPHCGTELPAEMLMESAPEQLPALAELVHDNADIGTGAIYRMLVAGIRSGVVEGVAVAGFHLSRILLDANRADVRYQVPPRPYTGNGEIYADYLHRRGDQLREEALLPWLAAVNELLDGMGDDGVVYHHHTYDIFPLSPRPYDRSTAKRPAFQLLWKRPAAVANDDGDQVQRHDPGLTTLENVVAVRDQISRFLEVQFGLPDSSGGIDQPLTLPPVPFSGARAGDPPHLPQHVIYDLRKDILSTEERVRSWVEGRPWGVRMRFAAAGGGGSQGPVVDR